MSSSVSVRAGYHHGDLRNALIEAAAELARTGGPQAVTIRAAARAVGVTPTAAYRHFSGHEQLLDATRDEAMLRMSQAMNTELACRPEDTDRVTRALRDLAAIGRGYLNFALAQPGLFRTAFCLDAKPLPPVDEQVNDGPFQKLLTVLDELVDCGYLPAERRPMAEFAAWSLVHGMATLLIDGALSDAGEDVRKEVVVRSMTIFAEGLGGATLTPELRAAVADAARG
ncbi:TetR/AcrR family transcriptional regulator [Prauserella muralis]|uniref:Transcriptional regulator n=1 Tax=Prauserella muralis TaxID=588067 RepID=A0A2V4AQX2_9PSEU|nr:TetR/AcrR family transcriptional regulator [Prauserella muralis]PXY22444.1 transcriptional regulator [Prauserella muralis]TWE28116.1 TetR family transcriptional regulator [Prauserella muralis]